MTKTNPQAHPGEPKPVDPRVRDAAKKQVEQQKKINEARQKVRKIINSVANTDDGLEFLVFLADACGFNNSSILRLNQQGSVDPLVTAYEEGRRSIFSGLRGFLSVDVRCKIEKKFGEVDESY